MRDLFENKNILILGFGREGQSTYLFLRRLLPNSHLTIGDAQAIQVQKYFDLAPDANVTLLVGDLYLSQYNYDIVIKSPGIPYKSIRHLFKPEVITSQSEIFLSAFRDRIIGITGTKGKSTTSSLLYEVLKALEYPVKLVGNIGIPPLDEYFNDTGKEIYVYEMSSHMLETIHTSPHFSLVTNVFQEHLDHYDDYQGYIDSKWQMIKHQKTEDFAVLCSDHEILMDQFTLGKSQYAFYSHGYTPKASVYIDEEDIVCVLPEGVKRFPKDFQRFLKGEHNLTNCLGVIALLIQMGITAIDQAISVMGQFRGLPHRLESLGTYGGIEVYNDSISTIPETSIAGIEALGSVQSLLLGGMDRAVDYQPLVEYIIEHPIPHIILMYATGQRLKELFEKALLEKTMDIKIYSVSNLEEAVETAIQLTPKGGVCLFSPAAASYGYFKDFAERGQYFKKYLESYKE